MHMSHMYSWPGEAAAPQAAVNCACSQQKQGILKKNWGSVYAGKRNKIEHACYFEVNFLHNESQVISNGLLPGDHSNATECHLRLRCPIPIQRDVCTSIE